MNNNQLDSKKNEAIIKIQNAIRNKRAIDEFSTRYVEKNKPKTLYEKYNSLYQPSTNLSFKPFISSIDYDKVKQDRLLKELEQKREEEKRINKLALYQEMKPSSLFNYTVPKDTSKSKFKSYFSI